MRWISSRSGGLLLLILTAMSAAEVGAQGPRPTSKTITWQANSQSNDLQIGILGEVARPGVYRVDFGSLSVQSLVRRAGGLTEEASLSIRIVRQDRVVQNLFFSPNADTRLWPNDLLVVESRRAMSAVSKVLNGDSSVGGVRPVSATAAESQGVQVAFLNVLDSPVIVKLRPEDARLEHVVQMLGQPIELAGSVKLLGPERISAAMTLSSSGSPAPVASPRLTDGTVLVFNKGAVNRSRLPVLPKPFDSEIAIGAFPSAIGGPSGQSAELRNVGQLAPLMTLPPGSFSSSVSSTGMPSASTLPIPDAVAPAPPQFSPELAPAVAPMPVVSNPRIATVPFTGTPRLTTSSSNEQFITDAVAPAPKEGQSNLPSQRDAAPGLKDAFPEDADLPSSTTGSSPFSLLQMLGIVAGVAGLIGMALVARQRFEGHGQTRQITPLQEALASDPPVLAESLNPSDSLRSAEQEAPSAESTPITIAAVEAALPVTAPVHQPSTPHNQSLERLIRNDLSLREEPVQFPEPLVLQGRLTARPIHRVDRASAEPLGAGPHFGTLSASEPGTTGDTGGHREPIMSVHPAEQTEWPGSGPHFIRQRTTEPTMIAADAASNAESLRTTPLADALRQLDGGRSS